jgi:hypothetical protein
MKMLVTKMHAHIKLSVRVRIIKGLTILTVLGTL